MSVGGKTSEEMASRRTDLTPKEKFATLQQVCRKDEADLLTVLLNDERFNITETTQQGNNLLHICSFHSSSDCMKILLADGRINPHSVNHAKKTPVSVALKYGNVNVIKTLGVEKNEIRTTFPYSSFHLICSRNRIDIAEYFLALGFDPSICKSGWTPIHFASIHDTTGELLKILLQSEKSSAALTTTWNHPISLAAQYGSSAGLKILFSDPRSASSIRGLFGRQGRNLLHLACMNQHKRVNPIESITFLLENGFELEEPDSTGEFPLHHAVRGNRSEVVSFVISLYKERGLDFEKIVGENTDSPLLLACENNPKILKVLLDNGFHPNRIWRNSEHGTALHRACYSGNEECIKILLSDKRIDVNIQNYNGETPLKYAYKPEIVKMLLNRPEIDPNLGKPIFASGSIYETSGARIAAFLQHPKTELDITYKGWTLLNYYSKDIESFILLMDDPRMPALSKNEAINIINSLPGFYTEEHKVELGFWLCVYSDITPEELTGGKQPHLQEKIATKISQRFKAKSAKK